MDYSNSEISRLIDEYIHSERDRSIMKDRLINGMVYEKLAEKYALSVSQVKRIVYKMQMLIFRRL